MTFFAGLLSITLLVMLVSRLADISSFKHFWDAARLAAVIVFVQVGIMHLSSPEELVYMIEGFMPFPYELVILTGITEIVLALGLLWRRTRKIAAWLLMVQLVAMFPANIYVAVMELPAPGGLPASPWYTWPRLLFQPVFIWWIWKSSFQSYNRPKPAANGLKDKLFNRAVR
ncbi:MAG: DoxX family membrane protein [Balneolaceae bacterium]|nr:DoxX family membrane protein [Balneolaceae bacterium]